MTISMVTITDNIIAKEMRDNGHSQEEINKAIQEKNMETAKLCWKAGTKGLRWLWLMR